MFATLFAFQGICKYAYGGTVSDLPHHLVDEFESQTKKKVTSRVYNSRDTRKSSQSYVYHRNKQMLPFYLSSATGDSHPKFLRYAQVY